MLKFQFFKEALSRLAGQFLNERMFLRGAPDGLLQRMTKGKFTGNKKAHPVFVLKKTPQFFIACPCTSKEESDKSHIPKGVPLEDSEPPYCMDKTSYILHIFPFVMPKNGTDYEEIWGNVHVRGTVPKDAIVGTQWKKSWQKYFYRRKFYGEGDDSERK